MEKEDEEASGEAVDDEGGGTEEEDAVAEAEGGTLDADEKQANCGRRSTPRASAEAASSDRGEQSLGNHTCTSDQSPCGFQHLISAQAR